MKNLILFFLLILSTQILFSQVRVNGYYRNNGTYVEPYMRSSPNNNPYDNYSFPRNTNPYTGKTSNGNPNTYLDNYYNRNNSNTGLLNNVNPYMGTNNYPEPISQNYSNTTINNNYINYENNSSSTPQKTQPTYIRPTYKSGHDEIYKSDTYKYYTEKNKNEDLINNQDNKLNQDNYIKIKLRNEQSKELNDWYENEYGKKKLNSINNHKIIDFDEIKYSLNTKFYKLEISKILDLIQNYKNDEIEIMTLEMERINKKKDRVILKDRIYFGGNETYIDFKLRNSKQFEVGDIYFTKSLSPKLNDKFKIYYTLNLYIDKNTLYNTINEIGKRNYYKLISSKIINGGFLKNFEFTTIDKNIGFIIQTFDGDEMSKISFMLSY